MDRPIPNSEVPDPRVSPRIVIVGGGLAGLAAAASLAERGVPSLLLESRPRLGGRASSFVDRETGATIDNCQHVAMGCCTNFLDFCRTLGLEGCFKEEAALHFIGPDGETCRFDATALPAPLHLAGAFRRLTYLSTRDRIGIARGLHSLARYRRTSPDGRSFADWLRDHRQTPAAIERFWHVVLVSALSESLDRIDIAQARKVFVDGFLANRDGWRVIVPSVPLDALYGDRTVEWMESRGATIRLQSGVERLVCDGDRAVAVELRGGERFELDEVVLAVPHTLVLPLLPPPWRDHPELSVIRRIESAPISSVHLWFDRPITELPHAVFVGRLSQWLFNRSTPHDSGDGASDRTFYFQVVISASRDIAGRPADHVVADVVRELTEVWPAVDRARLVHSRLVTEHRAVFSPRPQIDALRPPQQSPFANLQLAGDWTRTGWPATMEGAIRSGRLAAENVLRRMGRRERILQPDLPIEPLARLLLGL